MKAIDRSLLVLVFALCFTFGYTQGPCIECKVRPVRVQLSNAAQARARLDTKGLF